MLHHASRVVLALSFISVVSTISADTFHSANYRGDTVSIELIARDLGMSVEAAFDLVIKENAVVVDFYTTWCGPCRNLAPKLKKMAEDYYHILFIKVDAQRHPTLASRYAVRGFPTLLYFSRGRQVGKTVGNDKQAIGQAVQRYLN